MKHIIIDGRCDAFGKFACTVSLPFTTAHKEGVTWAIHSAQDFKRLIYHSKFSLLGFHHRSLAIKLELSFVTVIFTFAAQYGAIPIGRFFTIYDDDLVSSSVFSIAEIPGGIKKFPRLRRTLITNVYPAAYSYTYTYLIKKASSKYTVLRFFL